MVVLARVEHVEAQRQDLLNAGFSLTCPTTNMPAAGLPRATSTT